MWRGSSRNIKMKAPSGLIALNFCPPHPQEIADLLHCSFCCCWITALKLVLLLAKTLVYNMIQEMLKSAI